MINNFTKQYLQSKLPSISDELLSISKQTLAVNNGNIPKWEAAINEIKKQPKGSIDYQALYLTIHTKNNNIEALQQSLKLLSNSSLIEGSFDCRYCFVKLLIIGCYSNIKYCLIKIIILNYLERYHTKNNNIEALQQSLKLLMPWRKGPYQKVCIAWNW
jgi:hypothetical protein